MVYAVYSSYKGFDIIHLALKVSNLGGKGEVSK